MHGNIIQIHLSSFSVIENPTKIISTMTRNKNYVYFTRVIILQIGLNEDFKFLDGKSNTKKYFYVFLHLFIEKKLK